MPSGQLFINGLPTFGVVRHFGYGFAVLGVGRAHLDGFEAIEHVALHHYAVGYTVNHDGIFKCYEVEPAAAAVTTRYCTVLVANVANGVAGFVELRLRRTTTHTGAVGLENTKDMANGVGGYTQTGAYTAARG